MIGSEFRRSLVRSNAQWGFRLIRLLARADDGFHSELGLQEEGK